MKTSYQIITEHLLALDYTLGCSRWTVNMMGDGVEYEHWQHDVFHEKTLVVVHQWRNDKSFAVWVYLPLWTHGSNKTQDTIDALEKYTGLKSLKK